MQQEVFRAGHNEGCYLIVMKKPYNGAWRIDPSTRFLIRNRDDIGESVFTTIAHDKKLQDIYTNIGNRMWGSVGDGDLMEGLV